MNLPNGPDGNDAGAGMFGKRRLLKGENHQDPLRRAIAPPSGGGREPCRSALNRDGGTLERLRRFDSGLTALQASHLSWETQTERMSVASITVRKLDDGVKTGLRKPAAGNG